MRHNAAEKWISKMHTEQPLHNKLATLSRNAIHMLTNYPQLKQKWNWNISTTQITPVATTDAASTFA